MLGAFEDLRNIGMCDLGRAVVRRQVLLRDIGDIMGPLILREEMVIGLVLFRADFFRDGVIPFVGIGKDRVHIENHAAKIKQTVSYDLPDLVLGLARRNGVVERRLSRVRPACGLRHYRVGDYVGWRRRYTCLVGASVRHRGIGQNDPGGRSRRAKQAESKAERISTLAHGERVCYIPLQDTRFGPHMAFEKTVGNRAGANRPASRQRRKGPLYAAVDLGTNNCRLLVAAPNRAGFSVLDSHSQIARLGEGLNATGKLSDAAIERAMDALHKISHKLKTKKVAHVRCIATEACRQAENGAEFIQRVRAETGLSFKIISPREEARLAMVGCHDLIMPDADHVLVVDIGGGSTEILLVDTRDLGDAPLHGLLHRPAIRGIISLPIGVVTLTEAFGHLEDAEAMTAMLDHARAQVAGWQQADLVRQAFASGSAHMIGTSGTITCLTGVHLGLTRYRRDKVDGQWITNGEMMRVIQDLRLAGDSGRIAYPTIGHDRAPLMMAGCAIVDAVWSLVPDAAMRVGDRGLREGLLLTMMQGPRKPRSRRRRQNRKAPGGPDRSAPAGRGDTYVG